MRVPLQSLRGSSNAATGALSKLVILDELERQARIFHSSFAEAVAAADRGEADDALRHIQSTLFAGIIVDRILRKNGKIRASLGLPSQLPRLIAMRTVRDHMEHFDERLSRAVKSPETVMLVDWYLTDGILITSSPDSLGRGGRAFSSSAGLLFYDESVVEMFELDHDMLELIRAVREFRAEVRSSMTGRNRFGGGIINRIVARPDARARWESALRDLDYVLGPAAPDPAVRLWAEVADEPAPDQSPTN